MINPEVKKIMMKYQLYVDNKSNIIISNPDKSRVK